MICASPRKKLRGPSLAVMAGASLAAALLCGAPAVSGAGELIPSIGATKSMDQSADNAQVFGGLAVRGRVLPFLKAEVGAAYRHDTHSAQNLKVRQWPLTASLWVTPMPALYVGGGVGWYHTTFDFDSSVPANDRTTQQVGTHLGAGLSVPMTSNMGLDLNGRYVFMQRDNEPLIPTTFDPDFWSTSLGLVFKW